MKAHEVVSKDVGVKENGAKHELFESVPLHVQKLNYVYEMEDHVREKKSSNLPPKLRPTKKTL
jgi:hypothetical protein